MINKPTIEESIEKWKPIFGYEGMYEVSNLGRVRSLDRYINIDSCKGGNQYQKGFISPMKTIFRKGVVLKDRYYNNYSSIQLSRKSYKVHRLVAECFIKNPFNKPHVNHIDNNPRNNKVDNLEWVTRSENIQHAVKQNRMTNGENIWQSKLTENDIKKIRKSKLPIKELVKIYNVNRRQIYRIKSKIQWKHVI